MPCAARLPGWDGGVSGLGQFRVDGDPPPPPAPPEPFTHMHVSWQGRLLAFDQALATTGWANLAASASTGLAVLATGMIETEPTGAKGYEDSFSRGEAIFGDVLDLIRRVEPALIVCEMPVAMGKKFKGNLEAGLVACMAVRCAVKFAGLPIRMLNRQAVSKKLTGNGNADKRSVRDAVKRQFPALPKGMRLNEHTYDAMALGVAAVTERG